MHLQCESEVVQLVVHIARVQEVVGLEVVDNAVVEEVDDVAVQGEVGALHRDERSEQVP